MKLEISSHSRNGRAEFFFIPFAIVQAKKDDNLTSRSQHEFVDLVVGKINQTSFLLVN